MAKIALIVEDSPVQALSLLKLLEGQGLNVICAPNGVAGLELALKHLPDVIVLDIHMPEMDGLEACRRLKQDEKTSAIPVVLFTAHTEAEAFRAGMEGGAVDFIPKDAFSDVVLLATLRQLSILPPGKGNLSK
jgi:CheY-like chemotaxis protein